MFAPIKIWMKRLGQTKCPPLSLKLLPVGLLLAAGVAAAQQDFSKVQIKVTKVAGTVYMLEGAGGNIGVSVGEDGVVLVDDQFAPLAPKIREAVKGITDKPIKFVINTHFHGDHTGGNAQFSPEAPIIAQENVRKRLKEGGMVAGTEVKAASKEALPVITFNDRATVHLNGEDIRAIHFPHGHTDGDSVIFFPQSNVVHMGDDFVTYGFPFVDVRSGGGVSGLNAGGSIWSVIGGALGALGAVCIIWAFKSGGIPNYVMPLVFGGAPLVNVLVSMAMHPPKNAPHPLLYVGFLLAALGGGIVLYYKPS